jgi:2,3-bisphosphoglycerate-dependent phosphoglycerate mutase
MILYCIRHGETVSNAARRIQGQSESPLSPLGHRQCQAIAAALRELPIDKIYSSPLRRALDSAQCIADALGLSVEIEAKLMEINAGIFQGLTWDEIDEKHPADAKKWKSHDPDFRIPNGESRRDLLQRAREAFFHIRECGGQHVVVVAHGGLLSAALKALLEIPAQRNPFALQNGSISRVQWRDEVKLLSLNETAHLHGQCGTGGDL